MKKAGRKPLYDFEKLRLGGVRLYKVPKKSDADEHQRKIRTCANSYSKLRDLGWKFKAWNSGDYVHLLRIN